jgi:phosphoribosylformimino-5-aminoimidazole carboxamide ribotide isomerase
MIVIPAVDLRGGRCVRLWQGRSDRETVFSDDPVAMGRRWVAEGAERLHLVDLDGAFAGAPRQTPLIAAIVAAVAPVPVEVGGGLRDVGAVEATLATGVRWAVVGTRAALDPAFLCEVCRAFPDRIIVAVDGHGPRVAIRGWTEAAETTVCDLALRARDAGASALLYTDVSRDGTGQGPNVEATAALARAVKPVPVLASGGVATVDDIAHLVNVGDIAAVVVGRALYTGTLDLRQAVDLTRSSGGSPAATETGGEVRKGGAAPLREAKPPSE